MNYAAIAKLIDHSLLLPTMTVSDLEAGCRLALDYDVASVCILPYYLKRCAEILRGSAVQASTTIGFPHGGHCTAIKLAEARQALIPIAYDPHGEQTADLARRMLVKLDAGDAKGALAAASSGSSVSQ